MSSDLNRLDTTDFERRLLEAAGAERPSAELSARMAGAIGLAPGPGLGPLPTAKLASGWLSLGAIVAALGGIYGTWALTRPLPDVNVNARVSAASSVETVPNRSAMSGLEEPPAAVATSEPVRPAPAAGNAAEPAGSPRESKAGAEPATNERGDLREEIRAIDAVRSALAARAPARALSLLKRYSSNFPSGTFAQEAAVLRIEALEQSGKHQRAQALSRDFQSKHPNSPLSERLRRLAR